MPRRFQFSLRALLLATVVIAVPCAWMAANANLAHARKAFLRANAGSLSFPNTSPVDDWTEPVELAWIRRAMGDEPVGVVYFQLGDDRERFAQMRRLFPEADVILPNGSVELGSRKLRKSIR